MKLKQVFVWLCILLVSVNAYAGESQTTTTTKNISPTLAEQLKSRTPTSPTYTTTTPLKAPLQPATGYTPEQADVKGYVPPPEQIPPDRSSGDPICEEGYYCKARLGGTSVVCQLGSPQFLTELIKNVRNCNDVANYCRQFPQDKQYCS